MAIDQSVPNESKKMITVDGNDAVEVTTENVAVISTRIGGLFDVQIGPDGEHSFEYDKANGEVKLVDKDDSTVLSVANSGDTLNFERVPLAPEYDVVSEAPQDPRGIVRFTSNTSKTAGLYSYSETEAGWIRIDKP